jgi:sulfur-oxidizing protein SoxX
MHMRAALLLIVAVGLVAGCATRLSDDETRQRAEHAFREGFAKGSPAVLARVQQQDEAQALCSQYHNEPTGDVAGRIEQSQAATIRFPASGKLMGDWRRGEKIAQDGYGMRFTDRDAKRPNGGNCYNCHQIAPQEISFGTVGPSLFRFGKLRGSGEAVQKYVYGKIYNPQATVACSNMPRFGHNAVLSEEQITHLVALLLDPDSPVNR